MKARIFTFCFALFSTLAVARIPIPTDFTNPPHQQATRAWPTTAPLAQPDGLRPCCAFGYNLKAIAFGIPVPFYKINNVVEADNIGRHRYNDSAFAALLNLSGLGSEKNGILYTRRGGFIDIAHVRDTADMTIWLFSQIQPRLGQNVTLTLGEELARREIRLFTFFPPSQPSRRYTIAAWLAARLAYQVAAWHEVAQWYGYESVSGFSETVSAFSPEDLYSNLLGARIAANLILTGHAASVEEYDAAMDTALTDALLQLDAQPATQTRERFDRIDGLWWNSRCRVPQKFLVLRRDYNTGDLRWPTLPLGESARPQPLTLPEALDGISLAHLGELRLWPGKSMKQLPVPNSFYRFSDFPALANMARISDIEQRRHLNSQCEQ